VLAGDELERAWAELCEYVASGSDGARSTHDVAQRLETVALLLGYSAKQVKTWIKSGLPPSSDRAREKVVELFRRMSRGKNPYWHLASSVSALLGKEPGDFSALRHYAGQTFLSYRLGLADRFIIGEVVITNSDDTMPIMHYHASEQKIGKTDHKFDHSGPIFNNLNRMYFLAVGRSDTDVYMRTMIFKMVENPRNMVTFGMVLTEHFEDDVPMAAKTALVHADNPKLMDESFLTALEAGLKSNGKHPDILIGTKKLPS
jgi:hypothetical protein